jgi:hypothetical protein
MRFTLFGAVFLAITGASLAAPTRVYWMLARTVDLTAHQAVVTPEPCVLTTPEPSEEESSVIFDRFVDAFLVKKNLTEAFSYIDATYIVRNCIRSIQNQRCPAIYSVQ